MTRGRRLALVLALWLAAVGVAVAVIVRTPFVADLSAFLPASTDRTQQLLIGQLKSGVPARTLMIAIEGGSAEARTAASKALAAELRASGLFEQVNNGDTDAWASAGTWVFERRYLLSPGVTPQHFTAPGLSDAIADTLSLLGTPAGNRIKPLVDADPTGESVRIAEMLIPARTPRTENGVWVGREAPRAVLMAVTRAAGADLDAQAAAIERIRTAFAPQQQAGLTLQMTGTPIFSVDSRAQIEREIRWLAISGTLVMGVLLLVAFASLVALGVAALPVATGVLVGIATVGAVYGNVHGVTLGFGSTLIGEAVDYAIYYLIQANGANLARGDGWRAWLKSGWPTIRLGVLTSVCGFAALVFSGFPGLAQLGVFSIAGLIGAAATARFVLPVLMPDGSRGLGARRHLGLAAERAATLLPRTRWLWLALGAASLAVIVARGNLWTADLTSLSTVPREAIALDASLRADVTANEDGGGLVVVSGPDVQAVLRGAEAVAARLDPLVEKRVIAGFSSPARLMPSLATQKERQAALPAPEVLRPALAEATRDGPLRADRLEPFIAAVDKARTQALETPESARGSPIAALLEALLVKREDGTWSALIPVQAVGETVDAAAVQRAIADVPEAQWLEIGRELTRLYDTYLGEARTQALLGALGVIAVVAVSLRSPRRVLAVCQPLLLAVLITLGGLAAAGVPLGILHLVGLLLVVAVGSNYALFFDMLQHAGRPDLDTLASLLLANLTTVAGFGLIALSDIPALSQIGWVVAPGALLGLLLSAAFAPRRSAV